MSTASGNLNFWAGDQSHTFRFLIYCNGLRPPAGQHISRECLLIRNAETEAQGSCSATVMTLVAATCRSWTVLEDCQCCWERWVLVLLSNEESWWPLIFDCDGGSLLRMRIDSEDEWAGCWSVMTVDDAERRWGTVGPVTQCGFLEINACAASQWGVLRMSPMGVWSWGMLSIIAFFQCRPMIMLMFSGVLGISPW